MSPTVLSYDCPSCGVHTASRVLRGRTSVDLQRVSERSCEHGDVAIGDLVDGLDPEQRCENCGCNPCTAGAGPWSCELR